jgi:hypothetical protein
MVETQVTWKDGKAAATWIPVCNAAEEHHDVPHNLCARQCFEESGFNPLAHNPSGATGLMQLIPEYFPGAGQNPIRDIDTGVGYVRHLYEGTAKQPGFRDWQLALAAYDWGPGNIRKWLKAKGTFATLPPETRNYVSQIIADVPVEGMLCKILSPPSPQPTGSLISPSSGAPSSGSSSAKPLFSRVISIFRKSPAPSLPLPSQASSPSSASISSLIVQPKEVSMSTPAPTTGQAVLAMLESDLITAGGVPFETLLQNLITHKGNALAQGADWLQFLAAAPGAGIQLEVTLEGQILNAVLSKVQTAVAAKGPASA